jgi:hypothetical protein
VRLCKSYKAADQEIREAIVKIEAHWLKIQHQLEFLSKIWPNLDEDYRLHQHTVLQVLHSKIMAATALIDGVIGQSDRLKSSVESIKSKSGETRRAWYAVSVKKNLNTVFTDLKDWSEIFDMSWFLITLQPGSVIDQELDPVEASERTALSTLKSLRDAINFTADSTKQDGKSLFLLEEMFDERKLPLNHSWAEIWHGGGTDDKYIVDSLNQNSSLANICNLAKRMMHVEPAQFGVLKCRGVLKPVQPKGDENDTPPPRFVFSIPSHFVEPRSLRQYFLSGLGRRPLDERFAIAQHLAKAVMFVHSAGFVHKNIRPETVLVLRDEQQNPHAVLTGFRDFRLDQGKTLLRGDNNWEANLYRHPTRQGVQPEEDYVMQHDIYALGVCLLEIGLASSFVLYDVEMSTPQQGLLLDGVLDHSIKDARRRAFETKRGLVRLAELTLPLTMGRRYAEATLICLRCLDKDSNALATEAELLDENGVLIGVRFIEKVKPPNSSAPQAYSYYCRF